jgi:hypothetical protein
MPLTSSRVLALVGVTGDQVARAYCSGGSLPSRGHQPAGPRRRDGSGDRRGSASPGYGSRVAAAAVSVAGSDAVPSAPEVICGDRAARLAARAVGKGTLRLWHDTAAGYLAVLKEIVVNHRAEELWLAALVARQDEEVR